MVTEEGRTTVRVLPISDARGSKSKTIDAILGGYIPKDYLSVFVKSQIIKLT